MPEPQEKAFQNPLYDYTEVEGLDPTAKLRKGQLIAHLLDLYDLEFEKMKPLLLMRSEWMETGLPVTFNSCTITEKPDGTFELHATGKRPPQMKIGNLEGRKVIVMASPKALDEQLDMYVAPFYAVRGAVNMLQIVLGVGRAKDPRRKEEVYLELFRNAGEKLSSPRKFGASSRPR